jgi:DNA-binding transcriptional ArsR family regulator
VTTKQRINWEAVATTMLHPIALYVLHTLAAEGRRSPVQLARGMDENVSLVAYHVSQLRRRGLIRADGTRPVRGASEHFYVLAETVHS